MSWDLRVNVAYEVIKSGGSRIKGGLHSICIVISEIKIKRCSISEEVSIALMVSGEIICIFLRLESQSI